MTTTDRTLLARWTRDGDAQAFAELMDRHARMVLGVCRRILGDANTADDVAQECFLRLAHAEYGPRSNVAGWLHRVATNVSISALRAARERPVPVADLEPPESATPWLSEWRELEPHVDAAIAELPDELRAVVVAHFLEGRSQRELGRELGLGDRTVGYRIHKGIERLRKRLAARGIRVERDALAAVLVALPAPEVVPVAWSASLGKLALAGPHALGGAAAVATVGWAVAGSTKAVLAVATALLVIVVGGLWNAARERVIDPAVVGSSASESGEAGSEGQGPERGAESRRVAVDVEPDRDDSTAAAGVVADVVAVVGRCVDADGEEGVADCEVVVRPLIRDEEIERAALFGWSAPENWERRGVSGVDGRFAVELEPGHGYVRVEFTPRVGLPWGLFVQRPMGGEPLDLGEVRMIGGAVLPRIRVENSAGAPELDVELKLVRGNGPELFDRATRASVLSVVELPASDRSGVVRGPERILPGSWQFGCAQRDLVAGEMFELPTDAEELVVVLRPLAEMERITGTVVDPAGRGIEGVIVDRAGQGIDERFETDAQGRFVILQMEKFLGGEQLVLAMKPGWQSTYSESQVPWGTDDLRLVMQPAREIELRVVEEGTGVPVEHFGLRVQSGQRQSLDPRGLEEELMGVQDHPGGIMRLPVDDGAQRILIEPQDPQHGLPAPLDLYVSDAIQTVFVVEVPRMTERSFEVTDAAGSPVVGSTLSVVVGAPDSRWQWMRGKGTIGGQSFTFRDGWQPRPLRVFGLGTTDAGGRVVAPVPLGQAARVLVRGADHMPFDRVAWDLASEPDPIPVVITTGGTLIGNLEPPELIAGYRRLAGLDPVGTDGIGHPAVQLVGEGEPNQEPVFPARPIPLPAPGEPFRIEHVPPGPWRLRLTGMVGRPGGGGRLESSDVAEVPVVGEGEVREMLLDLSAHVPARLRGRVLVNGVPAQRVLVWTERSESSAGRGVIGTRLSLDAEGRFDHMQLPGSMRVSTDYLWSAPIDMPAGSDREHVFSFEAGDVELRLVDSTSAPVAEQDMILRLRPGEDRGDRWSLKTDADGRASITEIEPGRWTVLLGDDELGHAQVQAGQTARVEIQIR